jgi:hypothetical protein
MHLIQKRWICFLRVRRLAIGLFGVCPIWNHLAQSVRRYISGCSIHIKPTRKFEIVFIWTDRAKCVRHNGIINSVAANKTHLTLSALSWNTRSARAPYLAPVKSHLLIRIRRAAETEPPSAESERWMLHCCLACQNSMCCAWFAYRFIYIYSLIVLHTSACERISATALVTHLCIWLISFNLLRWFIVCLQMHCHPHPFLGVSAVGAEFNLEENKRISLIAPRESWTG